MKKTMIFILMNFMLLGGDLVYIGNFNGHEGFIKVNNSESQGRKIYTLEVEGYMEYFELDNNFETLYWELICPEENTDIKCRNMEDFLELEGTYRGKAIKKQIDLDGYKWVQLLPYGLKDGEEFRIIASTGSNAMKCGTMTVKSLGYEEIEVEGVKFETEHLKISLKGILSFAWKGNYWYNENEELLIKLDDKNSSIELYNLK